MRPTSASDTTVEENVPTFDTHSGELAQININFVNCHNTDVNYATRTRPVRNDQEETFYRTDNGEIINPNSVNVVGETGYASSYVLQMLRLGGRKACLFYDSGSNGNLISGALAEELLMKVVDDRPTGIGTAGAGGAWTFYGSYVLGLGPDQEGNYYRISAQGMRCVTDKFSKYDLHPINKELKQHDPHGLGKEKLPLNIGGMPCTLLLGINCKLQPLLETVLPSGLGVYRCQLKDMFGSRLAYGGPHPVFSAVFSKAKHNVNYAMRIFQELVSQYLNSPYVQIGYTNCDKFEEPVPGVLMLTNENSPNVSDLSKSIN